MAISVRGGLLGGLGSGVGGVGSTPPPAPDTVRKMRAWVDGRMASVVGEGSRAEYGRVYARLQREGRRAGTGATSQTRCVERAAYRYHAAQELHRLLQAGDTVAAARIWSEVNAVDRAAREAKRAYEQRAEAGETVPPDLHQVKHSKRRSLRGLPPGWREALVEAAAGSKYAQALRVLAVSGCRPVELAVGVEVRREGGEVVIRINGAKCRDGVSGQAWRELRYPPGHPLVDGLAEGVHRVGSAKAIANTVTHYATKAFRPRKEAVSPYSFRHALASDLKASGRDFEEIAAAMGHQSTGTQSLYGSASGRSGGGLAPSSIKAASAVRDTARTAAQAMPARTKRARRAAK